MGFCWKWKSNLSRSYKFHRFIPGGLSTQSKAIDLLNTSASKLEVILAEMQVTIKLAQSGNVKSAIGMLNMDDGFDSMFALNQAIDQLINRYYQNIDTKVDSKNIGFFGCIIRTQDLCARNYLEYF